MSTKPAASLSAATRARAEWVSRHILPIEHRMRGWLARWGIDPEDRDEILQDAYCRIAMLEQVDHIEQPGAYFFSIVRNLTSRRLKRRSVVPLETIAEMDASHFLGHNSPEQSAADRQDYERLLGLIRTLPARCRQIVELRKMEGWSQRQIADHLGISEKTVEKQIWLGLRSIRFRWNGTEAPRNETLPRTARR